MCYIIRRDYSKSSIDIIDGFECSDHMSKVCSKKVQMTLDAVKKIIEDLYTDAIKDNVSLIDTQSPYIEMGEDHMSLVIIQENERIFYSVHRVSC